MPAGLSLALLKAIEGLNKELDWPNSPRTVYLQMPQRAFPARLIKPQAAPCKKTRRLVLQPDRAEQAPFELGRTPPSKGS